MLEVHVPFDFGDSFLRVTSSTVARLGLAPAVPFCLRSLGAAGLGDLLDSSWAT